MNTEDLVKLRDQAGAEHTMALAKLAEIDGNLKLLRAQRRVIAADVEKARGALRFAEIALAPAPTPPEPKPSPALERAKAALAASGPSGDVAATELEALIVATETTAP